MQDAILALDQGTTSSRAIVFDMDGQPIAQAQQEFAQHYPQPGWVEHDPEEIWTSTRNCMVAAVRAANEKGYAPICCGITNQRETSIVWDRKTGAPIHNAIVWQDRRTAGFCAELKSQGHEPKVQEITGLVLDPYFSASKIGWILGHVDGARERAVAGELAFGTVDSWLLWNLTGGQVHASDATNASRTSLLDIRTGKWSDDMLGLFGVPPAILPDVYDCAGSFGHVLPEILGTSIPITGMAGDQQAAAIGQACFSKGDVKSTYGTGAFLLVNTGDEFIRSQNRLLGTICYQLDGHISYALEGSVLSAGSTMQWIRDELGLVKNASESEALATSIPDTGGVVLVPAFAGLGAPHWDANARGALLGMTRGTGKAQIVRAALEAVAYQTRDLVQALTGDGVQPERIRVDGGMTANNWLLQFLSDVLDLPVERPLHTESTAIGAAILAALGTGRFPDLNHAARFRKEDRVFSPEMDSESRNAHLRIWDAALARISSH